MKTGTDINKKKIWSDLGYGIGLGIAFLVCSLLDVLGGGFTSLALFYLSSLGFSFLTLTFNLSSFIFSAQRIETERQNKKVTLDAILDFLVTLTKAAIPGITFTLLMLPLTGLRISLSVFLSLSPFLMVGATAIGSICNLVQVAYHAWQWHKASSPEEVHRQRALTIKYGVDAALAIILTISLSLLLLSGIGMVAFIPLTFAVAGILGIGSIISCVTSVVISKQLENYPVETELTPLVKPLNQTQVLSPLFDNKEKITNGNKKEAHSLLLTEEEEDANNMSTLNFAKPSISEDDPENDSILLAKLGKV